MMQDQMTSGAAGQKNKTYALAMTALMAAVTCVLAPMAIPIGPVPISLTNLAIYLSLYLLGWKWGTASYVVYMLIGMVGVPVFSGFTGGLGKLAGPTGGYIIGFVPMAVLAGTGRSSSWEWPQPRRCATPSVRRGSASPWTARCPPHWACACSPSSPETRSRCCWP